MLVAKIGDGSLILGLSEENIKRLKAGNPIRISNATHGDCLPDGMPKVYIVYGKTEQAIKDELEAASGPGK